MAVNNLTRNIYFSSELEHLYITDADSLLGFYILHNDETIFHNEYIPNSDGQITIYFIKDIIDSYISDVYSDFTFIIDNEKIDIRVIKSAVRLSVNALDFISSCYLTTLLVDKITQLQRYELLSFYANEKCNVTASFSYFKDDNVNIYENEILDESSVVINDVNTIDVSPSRFYDESKGRLISYVVSAGKRSLCFTLDYSLPFADPAFLFLNNFGCWETFYLTGTKETEYDIKRSLTYINGRYKLYDIEDICIHKANSGILPISMLAYGEDLARAKRIYLIDNKGNPTDEIVVSDSEIKYTNDDDSLPCFEYTYRRTSLSLLDIMGSPKLFDNTFDITFN